MSELDILVRKYWKDLLRHYQDDKDFDGKEYTEKELKILQNMITLWRIKMFNKLIQLYILFCIALNIIVTIIVLYGIKHFDQIKTLIEVM